jgi:periplasmic divalent cation tolerance protein
LPEAETCLVYVTAPSEAEAETIARNLVEARFAASANVIPGARSFYWWQGKLEQARETVLILKTRRALAEAVVERVKALHSYECPGIVVLPIKGGNAAYLDWIRTEARPA